MSYTEKKSFFQRLKRVRSTKSFAQNFLLNTMAGQKIFLYNEKLPRVLNISFNEKTCMYSCKMCPYSEEDTREMYRQGSEMDFGTLKRIVASVPNDPYYSFDISAIGETLVFKPLAEFIAYMKKERPLVNVIISTNALMLNEEVFLKLATSGLDNLQISLYAENAKDHEFITETKTFERVHKNVMAVAKLKKKMGLTKPFIQIFMMGSMETKEREERFIEFWSPHVDKAFIRPIYNLGREIAGMTPAFKKVDWENRYPCITPWYSTAIRSNGDVLPCYMFHWYKETKDVVVGNINQQSLEEIWQGPLFKDFRRSHLKLDFKNYEKCQSCDLWDAYTNVWEKMPSGEFQKSTVKLADYLSAPPEYRGA